MLGRCGTLVALHDTPYCCAGLHAARSRNMTYQDGTASRPLCRCGRPGPHRREPGDARPGHEKYVDGWCELWCLVGTASGPGSPPYQGTTGDLETCPRHGGLSKNARRLWSTTAAYRVPRGSAWPGRVSNSHETSERCESRSAGDRSTARWSVCGVTHPLMRRWSRCGQARHDAAPASCRRAASAPPEAGARHERTLLAVGSNDLLGHTIQILFESSVD